MKKLLFIFLLALGGVMPAQAQQGQALIVSSCGSQSLAAATYGYLTMDTTGKLCDGSSGGTAVTGFTPNGNFTTLTVAGSSSSAAIPAGSTTVGFQNAGTTAVSCSLGVGSATATPNQFVIQPGSTKYPVIGANTFAACIDQTGTVTNSVVLAGGSGLGTDSGGGGGGLTASLGNNTSNVAPVATGLVGVVAYNSYFDGTNFQWGQPLNAGTAGVPGSDVLSVQGIASMTPLLVNPGTVASWNTTWAGGTLGAMANYGTSPGAVLVPGINAFVTNPVALGAGSASIGSVFGPTAVGSANANPPVVIGGTATGAAGANVQGLSIVATSTAPVTATNTAVVVDLRPDSPGIVTLGQTTKGASVPVAIASDQLGGAAPANSLPIVLSSQYPVNATTTTPTAVTASTTGTTAATAASLTATASVTNYVCGFTITADATALATGTATLSGTISGSMNYLQTIVAVTSGTSQLSQNFSPCIPASAANTAITITSAAAGTGGNTIVNIWGYRL